MEEKSGGGGDDDFMERVIAYFDSEEMTSKMEEFAMRNAHVFDLSLDEGESLLPYTPLHKEFKQLIENLLGGFILDNGGDAALFMEQLQTAIAKRDPDSAVFVEIFKATTDYNTFLGLMRDTAAQLASENKDGGGGGGK